MFTGNESFVLIVIIAEKTVGFRESSLFARNSNRYALCIMPFGGSPAGRLLGINRPPIRHSNAAVPPWVICYLNLTLKVYRSW